MEVNGKKIAGLGVHVDANGSIQFHTSLLIDLDITQMLKVLKIPIQKYSDKRKTASIEQRITTISRELGSDISKEEVIEMAEEVLADVLSVEVSGSPNAYQFSVQIASPDTGCEQYADWWEVLSEQGQLLYRRILLHSHVNEQPFVRSGGPVNIEADTVILIRAHMNKAGYGGITIKGTVQSGFNEVSLSPDFAVDIETTPPLPEGCDF